MDLPGSLTIIFGSSALTLVFLYLFIKTQLKKLESEIFDEINEYMLKIIEDIQKNPEKYSSILAPLAKRMLNQVMRSIPQLETQEGEVPSIPFIPKKYQWLANIFLNFMGSNQKEQKKSLNPFENP
jgi:hypothetical protein